MPCPAALAHRTPHLCLAGTTLPHQCASRLDLAAMALGTNPRLTKANSRLTRANPRLTRVPTGPRGQGTEVEGAGHQRTWKRPEKKQPRSLRLKKILPRNTTFRFN